MHLEPYTWTDAEYQAVMHAALNGAGYDDQLIRMERELILARARGAKLLDVLMKELH